MGWQACYCALKDQVDKLTESIKEQIKEAIDAIVFPTPTLEFCTGLFTRTTNRTGWWSGWTAVLTDNQAVMEYTPWSREHSAITSPSCVTDFSLQYNVGNWYLRLRRMRAYVWVDYRLLINGTVVQTGSNQIYRYKDERSQDEIRSIPVNIEPWGGFAVSRAGIPASADISVETRTRYTLSAAQSDAWFRLIGGLRSTTKPTFTLRNQVIGVK